jgi:hypothetical protein
MVGTGWHDGIQEWPVREASGVEGGALNGDGRTSSPLRRKTAAVMAEEAPCSIIESFGDCGVAIPPPTQP